MIRSTSRPPLSWARLQELFNDKRTSAEEAEGLIRSVLDCIIKDIDFDVQVQEKLDFLIPCCREKKDGKPTKMAKVAQTIFARCCGRILCYLPHNDYHWQTLPEEVASSLKQIVSFIAKDLGEIGNSRDKAYVIAFLEHIWRMENCLNTNKVSIRNIEKAFIRMELYDFLVEHHCVRAIPDLVTHLCKTRSISHRQVPGWDGWSCFPATNGGNSSFFVGTDKQQLIYLGIINSVLIEQPEEFWSDMENFLVLAGQSATTPYRALATLLAQAVRFRDLVKRGQFTQDMVDNHRF